MSFLNKLKDQFEGLSTKDRDAGTPSQGKIYRIPLLSLATFQSP